MKNQPFFNRNRYVKLKYYPIVFFSLLLMYGCGSVISPSTVKLSTNVGNRITEMEKLHQIAIQRYFDLEQQKIEDFLTKTWEPLFLKNFLGTSQVLEQLQKVSSFTAADSSQIQEAVKIYLTDPGEAPELTDSLLQKLDISRKKEGKDIRTIVTKYIDPDKIDAAVIHITSLLNTDEPAQIMLDFAEDAHNEMNSKRESLLAPLNQLRQETAAELSAAYGELIRGQSTITGRLEAASKVSRQQDQLLGSLGINATTQSIQAKLSNLTSGVDSTLGMGVSQPDSIFNTLKTFLQKK